MNIMTRQLTEAARAAAAIKAELKALGIKASVKSENYSMGNSVSVTVTDQPPAMLEQIKTLCRKYQYGHFDGMTDCYEYTNRRDDLPQSQYVSVNHKMTPDYVQTLIDKVNARYGLAVTFEEYEYRPWAIKFRSAFGARDFGDEVYQLSTGAIDYDAYDRHWRREDEIFKELAACFDIDHLSRDEGVGVYFNDDNVWRISSTYSHDRIEIADDFETPAVAMAARIATAYKGRVEDNRREQAARAAIDARNAKPIEPVAVAYTDKRLVAYFPRCNKNNGLAENDQEILDGPVKTRIVVKKVITLSAEDYQLVSESLLVDRGYLWEKIGGGQIEDNYLAGLVEGSPEYWDAWREHSETLVVQVINHFTGDRFLVNSEGYDYARYVGRTVSWYFGHLKPTTKTTAPAKSTLH